MTTTTEIDLQGDETRSIFTAPEDPAKFIVDLKANNSDVIPLTFEACSTTGDASLTLGSKSGGDALKFELNGDQLEEIIYAAKEALAFVKMFEKKDPSAS